MTSSPGLYPYQEPRSRVCLRVRSSNLSQLSRHCLALSSCNPVPCRPRSPTRPSRCACLPHCMRPCEILVARAAAAVRCCAFCRLCTDAPRRGHRLRLPIPVRFQRILALLPARSRTQQRVHAERVTRSRVDPTINMIARNGNCLRALRLCSLRASPLSPSLLLSHLPLSDRLCESDRRTIRACADLHHPLSGTSSPGRTRPLLRPLTTRPIRRHGRLVRPHVRPGDVGSHLVGRAHALAPRPRASAP